ncbi:MAG: hypothetical protein ACYCW6_07285 [Candidatus Xenobia bacterium]
MEFPRLQVDVPVEDEIVHFLCDPSIYIAYTRRGLKLHIIRSTTLQPDIANDQDFFSYMWVEAKEGFFLLTQHFLEGVPKLWTVYREMIPTEPQNFFFDFQDDLPAWIALHPPHEMQA